MTRLASQLRHGEVWVAGLWVATAGLAVLAALLGWGWLLGASLLLNYVADGLFFRVDERAVRWFNDRQMASVHRHLFREAIAALGWVVIERPGPLVVTGVIAAVIVVHGSHQAFNVPMIPFGNSSVTRINIAPSMNSQYGASEPDVKKVLA